jgi:Zn finger protein HypA/HybF involved in hydrogenase expression
MAKEKIIMEGKFKITCEACGYSDSVEKFVLGYLEDISDLTYCSITCPKCESEYKQFGGKL